MLKRLKGNVFVRGLVWGFCSLQAWFPRKKKFMYFADDARIVPPADIGYYRNVSIGEGSCIGPNAYISAINAKFIMKSHSGAAEGLTVHTGNHMSVVGMYFTQVTNEVKSRYDVNHKYDQDVIVEEDCWIGSHVTLLSGVTIGRGSIIGSGSVVRTNIPPYAIISGNPAKVVGFRFTPEEIIEHERVLYPEEERLPFEILDKNYDKYFLKRIKEIREFTRI